MFTKKAAATAATFEMLTMARLARIVFESGMNPYDPQTSGWAIGRWRRSGEIEDEVAFVGELIDSVIEAARAAAARLPQVAPGQPAKLGCYHCVTCSPPRSGCREEFGLGIVVRHVSPDSWRLESPHASGEFATREAAELGARRALALQRFRLSLSGQTEGGQYEGN